MSKIIPQSTTVISENATNWKNIISLILILFSLISITFYSSPMVLAQEEQQNYTSEDILICQVINENKSSVGSKFHQALNICNYQKSIGSNQALAELCYIFSDKSIDEIVTFCEKVPNQMSPSINETKETSNSQNNTNNPGSFTLFDGVSKFFSNLFNP